MKNLKISILLIFSMAVHSSISAQKSYTIDATRGNIKIHEINRVTLIGTDEAKPSIEIEGQKKAFPAKAEGLKLINPSGIVDNTGIGLAVQTEGDEFIIRSVSSKTNNRFVFRIPDGFTVSYESHSNHASKCIIENVKAEMDIAVNYQGVELSGVNGPMAINSVYGPIKANFSNVNQEGSISLYSVYSDVEVNVPQSTRANFKLKVSHGEVYSNMDLQYPESADGMKTLSHRNLTAKTNGGGVDFSIKSSYSNIYLRSK